MGWLLQLRADPRTRCGLDRLESLRGRRKGTDACWAQRGLRVRRFIDPPSDLKETRVFGEEDAGGEPDSLTSLLEEWVLLSFPPIAEQMLTFQ